MLFSVDRFEGELAVLIDEQQGTCDVARSLLPEGVKAGDMLRLENGHYVLDADAARARRDQILQLQRKLRGTR